MDQMDNNDKVFYIAAKIPCTKSDVDNLELYDRENPDILERLMKLIKES